MSFFVRIEDGISLHATDGVIVTGRAASRMTGDELRSMVLRAESLRCRGEELMHRYWRELGRMFESLEDFEAEIRRAEIADRTVEAKREHTGRRRREFNAIRSELVLQLIEQGTSYVCDAPGCDADQHLTIDHVVPLSRGGTDDIENLRFLCRKHNSQKGSR